MYFKKQIHTFCFILSKAEVLGRIRFLFVVLFFLSFTGCQIPKNKTCSSVTSCPELGAILLILSNLPSVNPWDYEEGEEYQGGTRMTSFQTGATAFRQFAPDFSLNAISEFTVGQTVFEVPWIPGFSAALPDRDGLGPFFHSNSCVSCHLGNGRALEEDGDVLTFSLVRLSSGLNSHSPDPQYGGQFQPNSVAGVTKEGTVILTYQEIEGKFADGSGYSLRSPIFNFSNLGYGALPGDVKTSLRVPQQVIGLGLLEAVPENTILSFADPSDLDGDGISGRTNYIPNLNGSGSSLGRFGWKANNPSLIRQNSAAFLGDLGITSPLFPNENCTTNQTQCQAAANGGAPEVPQSKIDAITNYMKLVAVPVRRKPSNASVLSGKELFFKAGCKNCHIPKMLTRSDAAFPELSNQTIRPYTDLLLHDMGDGLADQRPDEEADGREWRTPPLWGIGLFEEVNGHTRYLHDGRARDLNEAVLWHGGEAEKSKNYYLQLDIRQRNHLLNFLKSL
ncbi:c-type cytochrome [Leptospira sp. 201903071]|uniref:di-heme oxidoreductase family protein n=1 Tax=Leptospira ainazelensis TaxID=2810034 RepID=UPI001963DC3B|nr:di-heme oxidoredictase family protein [Leptospira ainazelensis]MBM9502103.1 c-type cytochrome [Leptospira ainazelensis]